MSSNITIIRHSPTDYNYEGIFMGTLDIPVNSFNENIIKEIQNSLYKEKISAVYSSPLKRSLQTAKKILGDDYPILIDERLTERCLGVWQGKKKDDIIKKNADVFQNDIMDFYYTPENGENFKQMILRIASFILEIYKNNTNYLIFTHNGVLRVFKSLLTNIPLSSAFSKKEPFLFPQTFVINDSLYNKIQMNPFYTVDNIGEVL